MTEVQRFELPRDDWYDSDGRIYKDVIIENLNAIEQKIFELQRLDAFDIDIPDLSTLVYDDVTLNSDERSIINLRSFLEIMDLINYPLECQTNGVKIRKVAYWNNNYQYVIIENVTLPDAGDDKPFIVLDCANKTISANASYTPDDNSILLGKYNNGSIISINSKDSCKINLLSMITNMSLQTKTEGKSADKLLNVSINENRTIGYLDGESRADYYSGTFQDKGAK